MGIQAFQVIFRSLCAVVTLVTAFEVHAAGVKARLQFTGDAVQLEVSGQERWSYNIGRKSEGTQNFIEVTIPQLDEPSLKQVQSFKSGFVRSVQVLPAADQQVTLRIDVGSEVVESFDYLTDKPSRLIVDLFLSEATEKKPSPKVKAQLPKKEKNDSKTQAEKLTRAASRNPASEVLVVGNQGVLADLDVGPEASRIRSGIFDGADPNFERFKLKDYEIKESALIAAQERQYVDFPVLREVPNHLETLARNKPVYIVDPKETEENKQARLLVNLYEKKRYNVFLKTLNWFKEKYPQSEYNELLKFMVADVHYAQWLESRDVKDFDLAMLRYREAVEAYPNSPLVERTLMLMSFATLDRGDYLNTLRQLQAAVRSRPNSPNRDIARLGIAEAFNKLRLYDDSLAQLTEIERNADSEKTREFASVSIGDIHFMKKDYASAVRAYENAAKKYPQAEKNHPNLIYNKAAAHFWMGEHRTALEAYVQFLKLFPNHEYAGYAMTRVGEIFEIFGAPDSKSKGAYLEAYFRYGKQPSAQVARIRLLAPRIPKMKPKEREKAIQEIEDIQKQSQLPKIEQFTTVLISDAFTESGKFQEAIDRLVSYYQAHPTTADTQMLSNRIVKNINLDLATRVDEGKFLEAMKIHSKYADSWLKGSKRIDTQYQLARAYEQAGVPTEAKRLYSETLKRILSIKGTPEEKTRRVLEKLPLEETLYLRLASLEAQDNNFSESFRLLNTIKNPEILTDVEQVERVSLFANLLEKQGEYQSAKRYLSDLISEWSGVPALVAQPYLDLAKIEIKENRLNEALASLDKISEIQKVSNNVPADLVVEAMKSKAKVALSLKQTERAIDTMTTLLENYEQSYPLAAVRYELGELHLKNGDIQKAADIWGKLQSDKSQVWWSFAQEKLKDSKWNEDYKKYIKRIPAMEGSQQ
jgi:tetratricopeptide (TPR) repeat protein